MRDRMPAPLNNLDRDAAVNVHQLRAGHWGRSEQYLHRIGRRPIPTCQQCNLKACPAARCIVCREGADTPEHVLLRCPCLAGARLRLTGNIHIRPEQLKDGELVEKRAEIERRLEDAARREKAELRQQRSDMFAQRKRKQQEVRLIEMKMARVKEPCIYFLPKVAHPNSDALLERSREQLTKSIEERRQRLRDDLASFDARLERLQNPVERRDSAGQHSGKPRGTQRG
ncbi:hypothetical protein FJT64_011711 [Amphibalanus amphitrite]|uniref:Pinin/SDK/MemA protein domain-containing protein n=1 Tax=Amphibalanus amphitrite TaxID=1232801 RepID=A0A6A4VIC4_AMPAM|nr:hypothetical protein FJT64_011711 [Amphibalanus amphitrite]